MDMPWTAFHEVNFWEAANWSLRAYRFFMEAQHDSSGSHAELLEVALKLLAEK
jgi:hypothetical protein